MPDPGGLRVSQPLSERIRLLSSVTAPIRTLSAALSRLVSRSCTTCSSVVLDAVLCVVDELVQLGRGHGAELVFGEDLAVLVGDGDLQAVPFHVSDISFYCADRGAAVWRGRALCRAFGQAEVSCAHSAAAGAVGAVRPGLVSAVAPPRGSSAAAFLAARPAEPSPAIRRSGSSAGWLSSTVMAHRQLAATAAFSITLMMFRRRSSFPVVFGGESLFGRAGSDRCGLFSGGGCGVQLVDDLVDGLPGCAPAAERRSSGAGRRGARVPGVFLSSGRACLACRADHASAGLRP